LFYDTEILSPRETLNRDFTVDGRIILKLILKKLDFEDVYWELIWPKGGSIGRLL
jgi:hypothetical protein